MKLTKFTCAIALIFHVTFISGCVKTVNNTLITIDRDTMYNNVFHDKSGSDKVNILFEYDEKTSEIKINYVVTYQIRDEVINKMYDQNVDLYKKEKKVRDCVTISYQTDAHKNPIVSYGVCKENNDRKRLSVFNKSTLNGGKLVASILYSPILIPVSLLAGRNLFTPVDILELDRQAVDSFGKAANALLGQEIENSCKTATGGSLDGWYTGKCKDGFADGLGTLVGYDIYYGNFQKGKLVGAGKYSWHNFDTYEGEFVDNARTGAGKYVYRNGKVLSGDFENDSILNCAGAFDLLCLSMASDLGFDVDKKAASGRTPLFEAITLLRNAKKETPETVATVRLLLEHGANTQYRMNPAPMAFREEMTPQEYLGTSYSEGIFNYKAPYAPKTLALFSDPTVMGKNAKEIEYLRRSSELGLSKQEFLRKLAKVDEVRSRNFFEGYVEAFKLTRAKQDFNAAQKLAESSKQKSIIEYLAVLATRDKRRIFNINTIVNNASATSVDDSSRADRVFFVFNVKSKSSDASYTGSSRINIKKDSPVIIHGGYKVVVRYTLSAVLETEHTTKFILTKTSTSTETVNRYLEKTFIIKPNDFTDSVNLDFGTISIAKSSEMLGGIGTTSTTLVDEPTLNAEFVKVEMLND